MSGRWLPASPTSALAGNRRRRVGTPLLPVLPEQELTRFPVDIEVDRGDAERVAKSVGEDGVPEVVAMEDVEAAKRKACDAGRDHSRGALVCLRPIRRAEQIPIEKSGQLPVLFGTDKWQKPPVVL